MRTTVKLLATLEVDETAHVARLTLEPSAGEKPGTIDTVGAGFLHALDVVDYCYDHSVAPNSGVLTIEDYYRSEWEL